MFFMKKAVWPTRSRALMGNRQIKPDLFLYQIPFDVVQTMKSSEVLKEKGNAN